MKNIVVIGAGTMGNGIANVFAQNGFETTLNDLNESQLQKAKSTILNNLNRLLSKEKISEELKLKTLGRLQFATQANRAIKQADLIIEAATENFEIKKKIFNDVMPIAPSHCVFATNTSSISIDRLAREIPNPERLIGMHFFNPVPVMQLVEIIKGEKTTSEVTKKTEELTLKLNKIGVVVNDAPGFISNRILMPMVNEAVEALSQGIAGVKEIDAIMQLGMAHPMGPLRLADLIGLDVCKSILEIMHSGLENDKYAPSPLLVKRVDEGKLGVKSGIGFYNYTTDPKNPTVDFKGKQK
jgi:3-hydroxybutyryl-CoA dehydrogenase